jgi:hypothetical protein
MRTLFWSLGHAHIWIRLAALLWTVLVLTLIPDIKLVVMSSMWLALNIMAHGQQMAGTHHTSDWRFQLQYAP